MSFSLVGRGNGQGGGELGGKQHSKTAEKRSVRSSQVGERAQNCGCLAEIECLFFLLGFQILSLDLCLNRTQ